MITAPTPHIEVNGTAIDAEDIAAEVQYHPAESLPHARREAAVALVIRQVLLQEAERLGIETEATESGEQSPEEARIQALLAQQVQVPSPDQATARTYYSNHQQRFRGSPLYQVSHILFPAAPDDPEGRATAKTLATRILTEVLAAPQRFAEFAREYSACPSKEVGGNLGQIGRDQTVKEFETYLDRMEPGTISTAPLETRYGFHIIHLERRVDGKQLPYEMVEEKILGYLQEQVQRRATSQYVQLLIGAADIQGIDLEGEDSPLVQ